MNDVLNFLSNYAVFPIAIICFGIGYCIKHFFNKLPNKFIPLILAIIGIILNLAFNEWKFTFEIILEGGASGLVATGSFEMIRNLLKKEDNHESN